MQPALIAAWRFFLGLTRPSRSANVRRMRERGESPETFRVREATSADLNELARVHVTAWNATYAPMGIRGPSVEIRARQWQEAFAKRDRDWFCYLVERADGAIVGFATGNRTELAGSAGELNKIYLLWDYQRLGLGRRLMCRVARRLLDMEIMTMAAYVDARNPSGRFFESSGAEWLRENGKVNYSWYVWPDLRVLTARCGAEGDSRTGDA